MNVLISNMGRAFIKAFGSSLIVVLIGLSSQPDLNGTIGIGIAGLMASIAAGLTAITSYVPQLSFEHYFGHTHGAIVDSFIRAFLASGIVAATGWLAEPNLSTWHAAVVGILVGAINAGFRGVQGFLTPGESPAPAKGLAPPPPVAAPAP